MTGSRSSGANPPSKMVHFRQPVLLLSDLNLRHDFYELDYLSENDRTRFAIQLEARREVLKCLLELNLKIYLKEVTGGLWEKKGKEVKTSSLSG
ncbi:MAG: hypothetical protein JXQ81_11925 [Desulfuromonadales bacterium]|nr:hypothetical protein [Desulfuromonadales bacterium]